MVSTRVESDPEKGTRSRHTKHSALFSLCVGRFWGVGPAGSYPLSRGLPADPGHGHGQHAGEDHHHQEGIHHLRTGHLRACWWLDRSCSRHHLCPLGRHHCALQVCILSSFKMLGSIHFQSSGSVSLLGMRILSYAGSHHIPYRGWIRIHIKWHYSGSNN